MNKKKRQQFEIHRNRTTNRRRSIRERDEREESQIKTGILLVLSQLVTDKNNRK